MKNHQNLLLGCLFFGLNQNLLSWVVVLAIGTSVGTIKGVESFPNPVKRREAAGCQQTASISQRFILKRGGFIYMLVFERF